MVSSFLRDTRIHPSMLLKFSSILRVETNKKSIVIRISEGKKKRKKNSTNNIFNGLEEQKKKEKTDLFLKFWRVYIFIRWIFHCFVAEEEEGNHMCRVRDILY